MKNSNTPIYDYIRAYCESGTARFHMPGHKGLGPLGVEQLDITEISGADCLSEASGIIGESECMAGSLFHSGHTFYGTEGSSQCIKAMLYLVRQLSGKDKPLVLAARNVHKAFIYGAALSDLNVSFLYPEIGSDLCACQVTPDSLQKAIHSLMDKGEKPSALYLTSPDYLGNLQDIASLSRVCHDNDMLLLVDNAHGAYLAFLEPSLHPLSLGADMCCDSAHKTLPVLTGGAYLHLAPALLENLPLKEVREAMALFGSTSPSYLTLASLDCCNDYLSGDFKNDLYALLPSIRALKDRLLAAGYTLLGDEPLKITLCLDGTSLSDHLKARHIEYEMADRDHLVLMPSSKTTEKDLTLLEDALLSFGQKEKTAPSPWLPEEGKRACSIRDALFSPSEMVPASEAKGRICASPLVSCPPAIPIVLSGEVITERDIHLLTYYGHSSVRVLL